MIVLRLLAASLCMVGIASGQIAPGFDVNALGAACTQGDADACYSLGFITMKGQLGVAADVDAGRRLLARACTLGRPDACVDTAASQAPAPPTGDAAKYKTDCDNGVMDACSRLGNVLDNVGASPADLVRSRSLHRRACDGGSAMGCANLGYQIDKGIGGPADEPEAARLYASACKRGNMGGCNSMGVLYKEGRHFTRDLKKARGFFERACAKDEPRACNNLADFVARGVAGLAIDWTRVTSLYTRTCGTNSQWGCLHLGSLYHGAPGVPPEFTDKKKSAHFFGRACALGHGAACYNAGVMHERGSGVTRDMGKAIDFYSRGCDLDDSSGCFNHGNELHKGLWIDKDDPQALLRWGKACELEHTKACNALAYFGPKTGEFKLTSPLTKPKGF